jgi:hypothetical protein
VGKTALLDYLAEQASGCRVTHAAGVESEMELAYAGLHQLLTPMLDRVEALPAPQRAALRTAFGLSAGSAPDRFLVGLATLSLLSDAAAEHPLLSVVDDAPSDELRGQASQDMPEVVELMSGYKRLLLDIRPTDGDDVIYNVIVVASATCRPIVPRASLTTSYSSLQFRRMRTMESCSGRITKAMRGLRYTTRASDHSSRPCRFCS